MKKISRKELDEIVEKHCKYRQCREGGVRAFVENADLRNMNLSRMDLGGMVFDGSDFSGAFLHNTDFSGASLVGINLMGSNVDRTNFTNADMTRACVAEAVITNSNFTQSLMAGVRLSDAILKHNNCFASVRGVPIYQTTCLGLSRRSLTLLAQGEYSSQWVWYVGCSTYDERTLRHKVKGKYGMDCDYLDAIRCLKRIAKRNAYRFTPAQVV